MRVVKLVERSCCAKTLAMCCRVVKLVERKRSEVKKRREERKRRMNEGRLARRRGCLESNGKSCDGERDGAERGRMTASGVRMGEAIGTAGDEQGGREAAAWH